MVGEKKKIWIYKVYIKIPYKLYILAYVQDRKQKFLLFLKKPLREFKIFSMVGSACYNLLNIC